MKPLTGHGSIYPARFLGIAIDYFTNDPFGGIVQVVIERRYQLLILRP